MPLWDVAWMKKSQFPPSSSPLPLESWSLSVLGWIVLKMATMYMVLYDSLSFSVDRAYILVLTKRIWQKWLDAISVIMLHCIRLNHPSWLDLKSCPSCCLWRRELCWVLKLQGNTFYNKVNGLENQLSPAELLDENLDLADRLTTVFQRTQLN